MADAPSMRFRPFEPSDLEVLGPWLEREGFGVPPNVGSDMWGKRLLDDPRILCLVVEADEAAAEPTAPASGRAAGFFRLDLAPDRSAEVTVLVAPRWRRRGVGRALLERALEEARHQGLHRLVALVREANPGALAFFQEAGFVASGRAVPRFVHLVRVVHRAQRQPPLEIAP